MPRTTSAFYAQVAWARSLVPGLATQVRLGPGYWQAVVRYWREREAEAVTLQEVLHSLQAWGLRIPPGTLRRWAAEGLIPRPRRYPRAEGRGTVADWPEDTPAQAAAAYVLLHETDGVRLTREALRRVRENALWIIQLEGRWRSFGGGSFVFGVIQDREFTMLEVRWICRYMAALHGLLPTRPVKVTWRNRDSEDEVPRVEVKPAEHDSIGLSFAP